MDGEAARSETITLRCRSLLHPRQGEAPGCLVMDQGRVVSTDPRDATGIQIEASDAVVIPGLVNAHTHLEFSDLPAPLGSPGISLPTWIPLVVSHRRGQSTNEPANDNAAGRHRAIDLGIAESHAAGVTLLGDIVTSPGNAEAAAAAPAGLGTAFWELLSLDPGQREPLILEAQRHLQGANGWSRGLSPHAPYSVHPQLLRDACELSAASQARVAMHLAETREELRLLAGEGGPFQAMLEAFQVWRADVFSHPREPLDLLRELQRAAHALIIHGNYLVDADLQFLGEHRQNMTLVHCPRTHAYFGHDPYPVEQALAAGVRLALGTDSRASNPDLNLWQDLQFAVEHHPHVAPADLLAAATLNGAEALGRPWRGWVGCSPSQLTLIEPSTNSGSLADQLLGSTSSGLASVIRRRLESTENGASPE